MAQLLVRDSQLEIERPSDGLASRLEELAPEWSCIRGVEHDRRGDGGSCGGRGCGGVGDTGSSCEAAVDDAES